MQSNANKTEMEEARPAQRRPVDVQELTPVKTELWRLYDRYTAILKSQRFSEDDLKETMRIDASIARLSLTLEHMKLTKPHRAYFNLTLHFLSAHQGAFRMMMDYLRQVQ